MHLSNLMGTVVTWVKTEKIKCEYGNVINCVTFLNVVCVITDLYLCIMSVCHYVMLLEDL